MVAPLALAGIILAKKAVAVAVYAAAKRYGVPKLYRNVLRMNRRLTPAAHRKQVSVLVRRAILLPDEAAAAVKNHWVVALASAALQEVPVPAFARRAAETVLQAGPQAVMGVAADVSRMMGYEPPPGVGGGKGGGLR